jgi:hypothetical protein
VLEYTELAQLYGMPHGAYVAVHASPAYALNGFGFAFEGGRTGVIDGKACARIFYGLGASVLFEPADDETKRAVLDHARNYGKAARADELEALYFPKPAASLRDSESLAAQLDIGTADTEPPKKGKAK